VAKYGSQIISPIGTIGLIALRPRETHYVSKESSATVVEIDLVNNLYAERILLRLGVLKIFVSIVILFTGRL
jgi:hypothetical protein